MKGNILTDKLLIVKCKSDIPLFNLEDFNCEIFPNKIHNPEDEVQFFSRWVPIDIPFKILKTSIEEESKLTMNTMALQGTNNMSFKLYRFFHLYLLHPIYIARIQDPLKQKANCRKN